MVPVQPQLHQPCEAPERGRNIPSVTFAAVVGCQLELRHPPRVAADGDSLPLRECLRGAPVEPSLDVEARALDRLLRAPEDLAIRDELGVRRVGDDGAVIADVRGLGRGWASPVRARPARSRSRPPRRLRRRRKSGGSSVALRRGGGRHRRVGVTSRRRPGGGSDTATASGTCRCARPRQTVPPGRALTGGRDERGAQVAVGPGSSMNHKATLQPFPAVTIVHSPMRLRQSGPRGERTMGVLPERGEPLAGTPGATQPRGASRGGAAFGERGGRAGGPPTPAVDRPTHPGRAEPRVGGQTGRQQQRPPAVERCRQRP